MFNKLKQFKDLRDKAKTLQTALADEHVSGSASFGKVKVEMDGNLSVQKVIIDAELLTKENQTKVQDAVKEACNDAMKKAQRAMAEKMKSMGDLDLSKLMK